MTANKLEGKALVAGDSRKPKFGEWLRGIYASERNPQRDGMYVRTVRRTGRFNAGVWYELTDGNGNFWRYESKSTVYLAAVLDTARQSEGMVEYEFEVWQNDDMQAGGTTATLEAAQAEAGHYAMMYGQDGEVELKFYERRAIAAAPADAGEEKK